MMKSIYVLILVSTASCIENDDDVSYAKSFFEKYGYMNSSQNSLTDFEAVLINFQEKYNLPVDGTPNKETIDLMKRPRCIKGDNNYVIHSKWNKTELLWYFPQANNTYLKTAKLAFDTWQSTSNLKFKNVRIAKIKPDITITLTNRKHYFRSDCQGTDQCPFDLGNGVLGHSYYPNPYSSKCIEIHLDIEQKWYFGDDFDVPEGMVSFLMVLTHEIGHAIGLAHSEVKSAIMYPWYQMDRVELDEDDKNAMIALYGAHEKKSTFNATTTTTVKSTLRPEPRRRIVPIERGGGTKKNLCEIRTPDFMFLAMAPLFPNYRMYVGHEKYLWRLDLNDMHIPKTPELIVDYLPKELASSNVSHVFQNTVGDLVTFSNNQYYAAAFPNLNIHDSFPLPIPRYAVINALFQTNSGQMYLLYNNNSYIEFNAEGHTLNRGHLHDVFPGVPEGVTSAFRYTDGHIYFFYKDIYYKYSEYIRKVVDAKPFTWSLFGVPCPEDTLLNQLKTLLHKIINIYQ